MLESLGAKLQVNKILSYAFELSSYNRVQGTQTIIDASKFLRDVLQENGVDSELLVYQHGKDLFPFDSDLVSWDITDAELMLLKPEKKLLSSTNIASTSVIAHSPPGEFEGELVYAKAIYKSEDVDGKVVLLDNWSYLNYMNFAKLGASAIIAFRKDGSPTAYPYLSLFPSSKELREMKVPAMTITRTDAEKLLNYIFKKETVVLKGFVKSRYGNIAKIPVVKAEFGEGKKEFHLTSHICHPAYTFNDNVSGAIGNLAAVLSLNKLDTKEDLLKNKKIVFLWVPEHSGTISFLKSRLGSGIEVVGAINLDMIGEKQVITGSSLNIVRPPISFMSSLEASLFNNIIESLPKSYSFSSPSYVPNYKLWLLNFEVGSDHDIYTAMGIPAIMINQWPDTFYHSSEDTIDKADINQVIQIGIASVSSILELDRLDGIKRYFHMVYGLDTLRSEGEVRQYREALYCDVANKMKIESFKCSTSLEELAESDKIISLKQRASPSLRTYRNYLNEDEYRKLAALFDEKRYLRTANVLVPALLGSRKMSFDKLRLLISAELGTLISDEEFKLLVEAQENIGVIEISK